MASHRFLGTEQVQGAIWIARDHVFTAIQRNSLARFEKKAPARSTKRRLHKEY